MGEQDANRIIGWLRANESLRSLLDSLVDESDCQFDHHGGCQEHGYLSLEPGEMCPIEQAKRLLAAAHSPHLDGA